jgi:PPOX class probable F420-dependent enzyme
MLPENIKAFVAETNRGVLTTFRRDGAAQMSIITCGPYRDGVAFTTTAKRAKLLNLQRDSRCSLLISNENWWGFVVLEGRAHIISAANTGADEYRDALRDVYRTAAREEHSNWEEYDQAMRDDKRSAIIVIAERIYGTGA